MSAADQLGTYAAGWTTGDAAMILSVASDSFYFDDPNGGKIAKADFAEYFAGMKEAVASIRGADYEGNFMDLSEVVTNEDSGTLTAWCWWAIPGTDIRGGGLIKVGDDGVASETITYYAKPAA